MPKKIKIAVVGTGLMGLQHIRAIKKSNKANLHSIIEIDDNAKKLSKKFKVPLYKDTKQLLLNKTLDAVIVATPNQLHEKHSICFLKAKIPVLLEKPISDNIKSARRIINSSKKNKKLKKRCKIFFCLACKSFQIRIFANIFVNFDDFAIKNRTLLAALLNHNSRPSRITLRAGEALRVIWARFVPPLYYKRLL